MNDPIAACPNPCESSKGWVFMLPLLVMLWRGCSLKRDNKCITQAPFVRMLMRHINVAERFVEEYDFNSS